MVISYGDEMLAVGPTQLLVEHHLSGVRECLLNTRWFKYDRDWLCVNKSQFVPVIFEPPCTFGATVHHDDNTDEICNGICEKKCQLPPNSKMVYVLGIWSVAPCSLVEIYQIWEEHNCLFVVCCCCITFQRHVDKFRAHLMALYPVPCYLLVTALKTWSLH